MKPSKMKTFAVNVVIRVIAADAEAAEEFVEQRLNMTLAPSMWEYYEMCRTLEIDDEKLA